MARNKFYGVRVGRIPGVYDNWEACKIQVERCRNEYRGFTARDEAAFYVTTGRARDEAGGESLSAKWTHEQQAKISASGTKQEEKSAIETKPLDFSQSFFSQPPHFQPDENADFEGEFSRFASSQHIKPGSKTWRQKRTEAIRHEIMFHSSQNSGSPNKNGTKEEPEDKLRVCGKRNMHKWKLELFQDMCREARLEPLDTIGGCVASLQGELINIVDYIDAKRTGKQIRVWPPHKFEEFRTYTLAHKKITSKRQVLQGDGVLEPLLQTLDSAQAAQKYQLRRYLAAIAQTDCAIRTLANAMRSEEEQRLPAVFDQPSSRFNLHGLLSRATCTSLRVIEIMLKRKRRRRV